MAFTSDVIIDSDFNFDGAGVENRTTGELIRMLKSSFRDADFAKVESILVQREDKLKQELETVVQANDWLKEKLDDTGMKKQRAEIEQKKLQALNSRLMERAGEAENLIEFWKKKYEGLESRIRKLDADVMLLASVEPSARVSSEIGNNVVEENVDLVGANVDRAAEGEGEGEDSRRPTARNIIPISDSDSDSDSDSADDCSSEESLSRNEMTCQKAANVDHSRQTGVHYVTGMFKRKHNSCPNVSENDNSNFGGVKDEDVEGNSLTADGKVAKIQKLSNGLEGSSINHCTKMAASSRTRVEKFCTPSSQRTVISRQSEEKAGTEYSSLNLMRDILLDMPGDCNIDCSSSSSTSSSGSESDVDLDFDFPQLTRIINYKKWESESDMLSAFEKDNELYLKAVCALYRMQTTVGRSPKSSLSSNNPGFNQISAHQSSSSYRGFNPVNAPRATTLAEFLVDNDSQGKLKKSVSELLQFDLKGLDDCKKIVFDHSKQLFEIYQKKEDPLFTA